MRDEIGICPNLASQFVLISDRCLSYGKKVTVTQSTYRDYRSTLSARSFASTGKSRPRAQSTCSKGRTGSLTLWTTCETASGIQRSPRRGCASGSCIRLATPFASLMLSYGEDPLWVARKLGHTNTEMLYRHYGKFIRNHMRRDGMKFLRGFDDEKVAGELPPANPLPERIGE